MKRPNGNGGRYVTVTELADKMSSLRWEMRAWMLAVILGVLLKFQVPQATAEAVVGRLF